MKKLILLSNISFILIIFGLSFLSSYSISQTKEEKEEAKKLSEKGIEMLERDNIVSAMHYLEQATDLDPGNSEYTYQLAISYFRYGKVLKAYDLVEDLLGRKDVKVSYYELAGNCQNLLDNRSDAEEIYKEGLKKFPNSGCLYLELGISQYGEKRKDEALKYFEKGIEAEPNFPGNYFWAATSFYYSEDPIWCILYGEAFMNLEKNTKKSGVMSEYLYATYRKCIFPGEDSAHYIYFSTKKKDDNFTFGKLYEETILVTEVSLKDSLYLKDIHNIRDAFIKKWYGSGYNEKFPNVIFDFHKELIAKGYFECYNYWLFRKGEIETFKKWLPSYESRFNEFTSWFLENSLNFDKGHTLLRKNFLK
jgi:tetratricopeptide (TPR) repeat protein